MYIHTSIKLVSLKCFILSPLFSNSGITYVVGPTHEMVAATMKETPKDEPGKHKLFNLFN